MGHLKSINRKADRMVAYLENQGSMPPAERMAEPMPPASATEETGADEHAEDVVALGGRLPEVPEIPHIPLGCSLVFAPGWEVDEAGGTAGLCQPVERDLFDCHLACFWPAHVPDQLNHSPDWTGKCAAAQNDWRKLEMIFP